LVAVDRAGPPGCEVTGGLVDHVARE
jgi:hypothetical protein